MKNLYRDNSGKYSESSITRILLFAKQITLPIALCGKHISAKTTYMADCLFLTNILLWMLQNLKD